MMGYTLQIFVTLCVVLFSCANPQYPHWDHWQPEPPCPPPPCEPLPHHPSPPPHPPLPHWPVEPCGPTHPQWPPCGPLPPPHSPLPHWPVEPCGPTHPQWPPCGPLPPPHPPLPHWPPVEPCAPTPPHWPSPVPPPPHPSPPLPHWPPVEPCAPTPPHWPTPVPPPPHPSPPLPHCPPVEPCDPTPPHWPTPVPHPSPHLPHFPPVEPCAPTPPHWPAPVPLPPHPSPPSPHWPPVEPCAPAPPHWPAPVPLPPHPSPSAPHWPPVEPCGPTSPHWPAPVPHWPPVEPCASTPPHWPAPVTPPSHPSPHWPPVQPCAPTPPHWPAPCAPHWPVPEPCSPPCPHWYGSVPSIPPPPEDPEVFPREFSFGVGSGPYQIEGAWQQDYAGESIIDRWIHSNPGVIADHSNGDCSADAYNHIDEDVAILRNLNVRHYRFGISWPRIIPTGYGHVNQAAIDHYRYLINLLKCNHIEPIVTIYHGDLPQVLQDQGGFLCSSFIDWYTEYARVLFENFGNDVKYWITFNNPVDICKEGYQDGKSAPGYTESPPNNAYRCGHNLLLAHAAVYHLYDDYYRPTQQGKISIALRSDWYEPASDCEDDHIAAENKLQFQIGWFANPIYNGDYPDIMKDRIGVRSQLAGLCESRLPVFTHHEIEYIKNTHDFFSLGYLSVSYCSLRTETVYYSESCHDDIGAEVVSCQGDDTPGIRKLIQWISENYHNPAIFIVSNGVGTTTRCLEDWDRIDYIQRILRQIRQAQLNTCARVYAYTYYSYIDGFEHTAGYTLKYGLYDVEFDCPYKTRTPRQSALYYQGLCRYGHI